VWRSWSALELAAAFAVGGSLVAVAVPAFVRNLSASKLSEPIEGLDRLARAAVSYAEGRPQEISFPPGAPLTPSAVPRARRESDPPDAWEHLTWRALHFRVDHAHAFAFEFRSDVDASKTARFTASAYGDLDGDGVLSTFEVRGERVPGQAARALPGMFVDREVE
jgi:hypothetical protein